MKLRIILEVEFADDPSRPKRIQAHDAPINILHRLGIGPGTAEKMELKDARVVQAQLVVGPKHVTPLEGTVAAAADDVTARIAVDQDGDATIYPTVRKP